MNRFYIPEIARPMSIKERLQLRKGLGLLASELELVELLCAHPNSLSLVKIAQELDMSKKGIELSAAKLVTNGVLVKTEGKLFVSESIKKILGVVETTTTYKAESSQNFNKNVVVSTPTVVETTTKTQDETQSVVETTTVKSEGNRSVVVSTTGSVETTTNSDSDSHAYSHGGNSNLLNNFFETLKEEKNKEEKINPPNPLDKKQENKKEERRVRRQNRAAKVMICGLMLHKAQKRKGKRLKRLPKRKPVKIINIPFETWWSAYQKKVDRSAKLEKKWEKLTDAERTKAMEHTARYVQSQPDKKYRKNPETYLNNKSFNNEIISDNGKSNGNRKSSYGIGTVPTIVTGAESLTIRLDELDDIEF